MQRGLKIAVGGGAAALLAVIVHGPLGMGAQFVAGLQRQADAPSADAPSARVSAIATCQSAVDKAVAGRTLSFRSGSAYLSPQSNRIIRNVAGALKQCAGLRIEIGGHGNATGTAAINQAMSEERAKRVRDALVIRGVSPDVLSVKAYGASKPTNAANARDPANRRVVFSVSKGAA